MYYHSMNQEILNLLKAESPFFNSDMHGLQHWQTVERNGHYLAQFTGADIKVISYFAHFHDCMRENEYDDPKHGLRGAIFAEKHRSLVDLTDAQFKQMTDACKAHTGGRKMSCVTVATCWDADRLDLGRVGIAPVSEFLFSKEAKRIADLNDFSVLGLNPSSSFKEKFYL
jgi:uncharacterized protein